MKKCSFYILLTMSWLCSLWVLGSCSADVNSPDIPDDDSEVRVSFSVGSSASPTRAAFAVDTPVRIYVYQRNEDAPDVVDFTATPFKTVEGRTSGGGVLSDISFTGGDLEVDGSLAIPGGYTYDFVVVVSVPGSGTSLNFGTLNAGLITGFSHGSDILAGRKEGVEVAVGQTNVNVIFTDYGADADGNLPHLCSAVLTEGRATQALIASLNGTLDYAVAGMDFKQCLPRSANLSFSGDPMALNIQGSGYTTSYSPNISGSTVTVTEPANVTLSKDGILLPYPLKTQGQDYNILTIDFRLRVNGGEVLLPATGVRVPAFEPGYRYRFITELDHDPEVEAGKINLYLSVESWKSVNWETGMGEGETHSWMYISLGSWNSVSWQAVMGEGETSNRIITNVSGWRGATWSADMGKNE